MSEHTAPAGPLAGVRVVEFHGIGPGPHCAMLLSDLGADVLRITRNEQQYPGNPITDRGRSTLALDLRSEAGCRAALDALDHADVLIEGFRPGVMERLGLGPDVVFTRNPRLIYGRMTGWGQEGPWVHAAGHDINYIAVTGALAGIGSPDAPPPPPLNLIGDFGGGSMLLAFGIAAALFERGKSGRGQVIDAAIVDGVSSLMGFFAGLQPAGLMPMARDANLLAGAAPFYRCYECADGRYVSVGAIEPHFYRELLTKIGAPEALLAAQQDWASWPTHCAQLAAIFRTRPSGEWAALLEGGDACFARVVPLEEAHEHAQLSARGVFVDHDGLRQVGAVPRFSRTPGAIENSGDGSALLARWKRPDRG